MENSLDVDPPLPSRASRANSLGFSFLGICPRAMKKRNGRPKMTYEGGKDGDRRRAVAAVMPCRVAPRLEWCSLPMAVWMWPVSTTAVID